jgi:hypothetical protein
VAKEIEYSDGWPVMELGKKEAEMLRRNLTQGERVLGVVVGNFGQAVVATDHKVLVLKHGMMSGQTLGGKASSYDYKTMVGIEVRLGGFGSGEFEILAGGLQNIQGSKVGAKVDMGKSPNGVVFGKHGGREEAFDAMAAKIREKAATGGQTPAPTQESIPDAIKKLSELHDAGILSDDEFNNKKSELLARM